LKHNGDWSVGSGITLVMFLSIVFETQGGMKHRILHYIGYVYFILRSKTQGRMKYRILHYIGYASFLFFLKHNGDWSIGSCFIFVLFFLISSLKHKEDWSIGSYITLVMFRLIVFKIQGRLMHRILHYIGCVFYLFL
jgi:hypothetical protein